MKSKRIYLFPVISFTLLVAFRITFVMVALDAARRLEDASYAAAFKKSLMSFETFFWPALLVCEIFIYLVIRKRIYKKLWVIFHSWCCIIAFFVIPLLFVLLTTLVSVHYARRENADRLLKNITVLGQMFFYFLNGVGHLFFILTIVKSFNNKQITANENPGVLDEFVS